MSVIPLDIQRRSERRWAARFSRLTEPVANEKSTGVTGCAREREPDPAVIPLAAELLDPLTSR
jgi:hypothetical protein